MELVLMITMKQDGQVSVTGPINNKVICYGMLQTAVDLVRDFEPGIVQLSQPMAGLLNSLKGNGS